MIGNVCKLTRRMARNEVMAVCREACKFSATAIGLDENISMANARVVDHLNSRMKKLYMDAVAFKNKYHYAFCWVKSGSILQRKFADSCPIRVKNVEHLANLTRQEQNRVNSSAEISSQD